MNNLTPPFPTKPLSLLCLLWGVGGVLAVLIHAVWRISFIAAEPFVTTGLTPVQWFALVLWVAFMWYSEGYRGFQKKFSPRVVVRALHISQHPTILQFIFSPVICMGLIYATRKRLIVSWVLVLGIICLVIAIQALQQILKNSEKCARWCLYLVNASER